MQAKCMHCSDKALVKTDFGFECAKCFLGKTRKQTPKKDEGKSK